VKVFGSSAIQMCFTPGILSSVVTVSTIKSDDLRGKGRKEQA